MDVVPTTTGAACAVTPLATRPEPFTKSTVSPVAKPVPVTVIVETDEPGVTGFVVADTAVIVGAAVIEKIAVVLVPVFVPSASVTVSGKFAVRAAALVIVIGTVTVVVVAAVLAPKVTPASEEVTTSFPAPATKPVPVMTTDIPVAPCANVVGATEATVIGASTVNKVKAGS